MAQIPFKITKVYNLPFHAFKTKFEANTWIYATILDSTKGWFYMPIGRNHHLKLIEGIVS